MESVQVAKGNPTGLDSERCSARLCCAFRIFRAAMFAEPTVTKIEEVVRLVHVSRTDIPVCLCDGNKRLEENGSMTDIPISQLYPTLLLGKTDRQECLSYLSNQAAPGGRCFHQAYRYGHPAAVAKDLHLNGIADLMLIQHSV